MKGETDVQVGDSFALILMQSSNPLLWKTGSAGYTNYLMPLTYNPQTFNEVSFTVRFQPQSMGEINADISIPTAYVFNIKGTGI